MRMQAMLVALLAPSFALVAPSRSRRGAPLRAFDAALLFDCDGYGIPNRPQRVSG